LKLRYVPLGGLGEVGLNMWALEWGDQVLVIDAGLMFPQADMLGIDLVLPDLSYLLEAGRRVLGVFLTHGHEDHVGGLPFVLKRLDVPVFGTRLTLGLASHRLREHRVLRKADLREVRPGDRVQLGPFRVETVPVAHSIPDAVALAVETPVGRVLYTGDFKLDPDPPYGHATDLARFRALGQEGVLLMLGDSTNAERAGRCGSERNLRPVFEDIFTQAGGRIVVASFASNIHRVQLVVELAAAHGRHVAVVGRSLENSFRTARELGHLIVPEGVVVRADEAAGDERLVLLTAGSQGEPLSALARFAAQRHPLVNVRQGDTVVISARPVPGNERLVQHTINNLFRHGARVLYSEIAQVHVSGHAYRDELRQVLELVKPRFFTPVHGEYRQLKLHADLALEAGMPPESVLVVEDGATVELTKAGARLGEEVPTGFVFVDGMGIGDVEQVVLRDRRHLSQDGVVVITLAIDRHTGELRAGPEIVSRRNPETSPLVQDAAREAAARFIYKRTKRRPMVLPIVTEV
jgi:ribonuclease J